MSKYSRGDTGCNDVVSIGPKEEEEGRDKRHASLNMGHGLLDRQSKTFGWFLMSGVVSCL